MPITAELGEGVYWDKQYQRLYWLDIYQSLLFCRQHQQTSTYQLVEVASAVLNVENELVYLASKSGIIYFNLLTQITTIIAKIPSAYRSSRYRTNDGVMLAQNLYLYSVMNYKPEKGDGAIIIAIKGKSHILYQNIAIPNTFIPIPKTHCVLITDSLEQKVYKFCFDLSWQKIISKDIWFDLSDTKGTPDGGCLYSNQEVFLAIWDDSKILRLDMSGNKQQEYYLPVPRPTNCVLNDQENKLYISSAYTGLSDKTRRQYPLSGRILELNLYERPLHKYK